MEQSCHIDRREDRGILCQDRKDRHMKWVRFRIKTTTEAEDMIISALYDICLEGEQIE